VIQGFADAIVYGWNESPKRVWRNKIRTTHVTVEHELRVERLDDADGQWKGLCCIICV
jgi:hypothetical protein